MKKLCIIFLSLVFVFVIGACGSHEVSEPQLETMATEEIEAPSEEKVDVHTAAKNILDTLSCGRSELSYLLGEDGYTEREVMEAMVFIDWEEQALNRARWELEISPHSRKNLLFVLEKLCGFTTAEATYAVNNCGADWKEQALREVEELAVAAGASYDDLYSSTNAIIQYLIQECEYTHEEACYAAIEAAVHAAMAE